MERRLETADGVVYIGKRKCLRCNLHQEISHNLIRGFGNVPFLEKEWTPTV